MGFIQRDWNGFKALYGNVEGARKGFEDACETLFRKKYAGQHTSQVSVKQGDGGIDIFIGEFGIEPITVVQCKFFLDTFTDSQKSQIRASFNRAITCKDYELKEWILCIPRVIDTSENSWWFKWKHKKITEYSKPLEFIQITNGNELIDMMKEYDLYNQIFQIDESIKIDEIHQAIIPQNANSQEMALLECVDPHTILFTNYSGKCEPYYFERDQDSEFKRSLDVNNIWLFGSSGVGKTALINRNLLKIGTLYCFCDLSPISITNPNDVMDEILCNIVDQTGDKANQEEKNIIKKIVQILCNNKHDQCVIVVDELSVNNDAVLAGIATCLVQLVTHYSNVSKQDNLRFVVSTIINPRHIIRDRSKASDYFQYIDCEHWSAYIEPLFDLICSALNINLDFCKYEVISESKNSPRNLKRIIRKIIAVEDFSNETVSYAIRKAIEEITE